MCFSAKCTDNFFVRPLGRTERFQNVAEVNIMGIAVYSSINLYAQLAIVAEIRPKQDGLRLSAGTASGINHSLFIPTKYSHKPEFFICQAYKLISTVRAVRLEVVISSARATRPARFGELKLFCALRKEDIFQPGRFFRRKMGSFYFTAGFSFEKVTKTQSFSEIKKLSLRATRSAGRGMMYADHNINSDRP